MSLKRLSNISKTIGFRLTVLYLGIFVLSALLLFVILYFFLSAALSKHDREMVLSKLDELSVEYKTAGITSLETRLTANRKLQKQHSLFIRVADAKNNTFRLYLPYQWAEFDIQELEKITPDNKRTWIRLPAMDDEFALEVASTRLSDGQWLQVGISTEGRETVLHRFRETFASVVIALVFLGFICGWFLSSRALRPIRHLIRTVQSIDTGKMAVRVPGRETGDELDELVRLFNGMLEKIETLINAMKGSLDNVAHDLRTPMTRFRNIAETALQTDGNEMLCREALGTCLEESDRILRLLNTLMDISEAETGVMRLDRVVVDIAALVEGIVDVYGYVAEEKDLRVHINIPNGLYVTADRERMSQVLANLLDNAIKYTPPGGQIFFEACRRQGEVIISIKDTGKGISQRDLPRIWDRLYRGDHDRSQMGLGLGLSQVKAIIEAHNGRIDVVSEPGKESTFSIYLPTDSQPG